LIDVHLPTSAAREGKEKEEISVNIRRRGFWPKGCQKRKKREKSTGDISYPLDGGEEVFVGLVNQMIRPVDNTRSEKRCI
jgi:hypothetical protein